MTLGRRETGATDQLVRRSLHAPTPASSGATQHADIGISRPGAGETPAAPVCIDGGKAVTLRGEKIAEELEALVEDYIEKRGSA